jgi:ribonuclease BN (tRNA processing enzyme)
MMQSKRNLLKASLLLNLPLGLSSFTAQTSAAKPVSDNTSMKLVLLGTAGGPTPKKNRAAPSQLIQINGISFVVDCGNGVAQQIVKAGIKLNTVHHTFITHHHSDHNADLGNLMLLAWAADLDHPIHCYGPAPIKKMMPYFLQLNEFDIKTRVHDEGRKPLKQWLHIHEIKKAGVIFNENGIKVTCCRVVHPPIEQAYAYRFDYQGKSIVISGDTTYSENLIQLAQGADILVHEVMHLPSLEKLLATEPNAPRLKEHLIASHTTCEQVGQVATKAGVKKLVLSHFVPGGYPYLEDQVWLDAVRPHFAGEIVVGRDLLEFTL